MRLNRPASNSARRRRSNIKRCGSAWVYPWIGLTPTARSTTWPNSASTARASLKAKAHASAWPFYCDLLKLLAPFFPYITEELYQGLFPALSAGQSIHLSAWPNADARLVSPEAGSTGETLVSIATAMRRFKSENNLPLGSRLDRVQLACDLPGLAEAIPDLMSVTRADKIELVDRLDDSLVLLNGDGPVKSALR